MADNTTPGLNCRGCGTPESACIKVGGCCAPCRTNKTLHHVWGRKETPAATGATMSPERLAEIRQAYERWDSINWVHETVAIADKVPELLEYVDELTRQLSDARRIAINSGIFQDHRGQDYDLDTE